MKILTLHNKYKYRGGEDEARESEDVLLRERGHEVKEIVLDNNDIGPSGLVRIGMETSWSVGSYRRVCEAVKEWRPDILDVHNFFPLFSPSVHYVGLKQRVPVIQTLHNYRLLCPGATFYRAGAVCEDCTRHWTPWPSVVHRCYRGSMSQTGAAAVMVTLHRVLRTWHRAVSVFITSSQFEKRKFVEHGFPESKILVKPNHLLNPGPLSSGGQHFMFVGRLSAEKGVLTLLKAMEQVNPGTRLKIAGDGPLESVVREAVSRNPRIEYLGRIPQRDVLDQIASARCLIFPSEWYETFGRVAAEAFSRGTPVIASKIGAVAEVVDDGRTGFHFRPGDAGDLAETIEHAATDPRVLTRMRLEARREYEQNFTAERGYQLLMAAYHKAIAEYGCRRELGCPAEE